MGFTDGLSQSPESFSFSLKYLESHFEGTHGRRGLLLVEIFPEDDDSPNCYPFTPFLALGRGSLVSRFLGPRLKKQQNQHYYLCIDVFWQVSRCHTVETVYPPTDATIVGNNLLARTWWAWSRWRLILRGTGLFHRLSSMNRLHRISYAFKRFSQIFLEKILRRYRLLKDLKRWICGLRMENICKLKAEEIEVYNWRFYCNRLRLNYVFYRKRISLV